jgi:hypothetical protein
LQPGRLVIVRRWTLRTGGQHTEDGDHEPDAKALGLSPAQLVGEQLSPSSLLSRLIEHGVYRFKVLKECGVEKQTGMSVGNSGISSIK